MMFLALNGHIPEDQMPEDLREIFQQKEQPADDLECGQLAAALRVMGWFFGVPGKSKACLLDHRTAAN